MLVPLALPPGVYRNGTEYQAKGRWRDASLVRWSSGVMLPVGGWTTRLTVASNAKVRGAISWRDNSGDRWIAAGTHDKLYAITGVATPYDITPGGFTAGSVNATQNLGYGGGLYGVGTYGTPRQDTGTWGEAATWSLETWGQYLLACSTSDGKIYEWQLNSAADAVVLSNAPTGNKAMVVTDERFVFALGAGGNFKKVQWSDREDNNLWTPAATNEAGSIELQTQGQIMLGIRTRGQTLILTDEDAHSATYQGPPFVYGFERVGSSCGAVSRKCAANTDAGVFWMGPGGFYNYAGGMVQEVACEVVDYLNLNLNRAQITKVHAVANSQYDEVWWFYPSGSNVECSDYIAYNYKEGHWSIGTLARTAAIDRNVFANPVWFGPDGVAYNHEIGNNHNGSTAFCESGAIEAGNGDSVLMAVSFIPDEKTAGDATVQFKTRFYPNGAETSTSSYSLSSPTDVRFTGRQIAMRVTGDPNTNWRWGVPRLEVRQGGRR